MATNELSTKGSLWRKWDFHLHTPFSILNNGFGDAAQESTWNNYIDKVEEISKKNEISAIGFTDYFMIEGYKKILEYKSRGKLENIFVFPNIEFRLDKTVIEKEGKQTVTRRLNFHIIFSPDVPIADIEEHFLDNIKFIHEQETFASAQVRKLKISNLKDFGHALKLGHENFGIFSDLHVGCMNAVVDSNELKKLLEEDGRFKGKYLICLAEDHSLLDWDSQAHGIRKQLLQMSHCVFSSNTNSKDFLLGKKHGTRQEFIRDFKSVKPCIWGCDAHSFNEHFLEPDKNRDGKTNFCWVKGDLSWEGVRQILYEPEERVRIQQENPETQKSIHSIEKIAIQETQVNKNLKIKETSINLNHNLISIIGGKGTGKTALLDIIASCFREGNESISSSSLSFYNRLYEKPGNNSIRIKLSTIFKQDAIEKNVGSDDLVIEDANIRYITQNHFEGLSSPTNNLSNYVFDLLFEKYQDELREYKDKKNNILDKQRQIESVNLLVEQLSQEIDKIKVLQEEKERKNGDQIDCEQRIKEIEDKGAIDLKLNELTDTLTKKREERKEVESAQKRLIKLKSNIKFLRNLEKLLTGFNNEFSEKLGLKKFEYLNIEKISEMETIILKNSELLSAKEKTLSAEIDEINKQLESFQDTTKVIRELKQKLITTLEDIKNLEKQITEIKGKEVELNELIKELFDTCVQTITDENIQADFLNRHIQTFEIGNNELLRNIKFFVQSRVNEEKYCSKLYDVIDKRSVTKDALIHSLNESIIEPINNYLKESNLNADKLKDGFSKIEDSLKSIIRTKASFYDLRDALFKIPIDTSFNITFDQKPLEKLSMGQRAIVLLQIILAYDDKPLLIDQPEEALDNAYIYDQLVSAFRSAKKKRQIIIVTHNANLVVNTDSEQIIIADYKNEEISYTVGTIENPSTQEQIKKILEGGKEAFERRGEKYGYKI